MLLFAANMVYTITALYIHSLCITNWLFIPKLKITPAMHIGETGASCYRGRLLQGRFMQNYRIDGDVADSSCIRIHQGNH